MRSKKVSEEVHEDRAVSDGLVYVVDDDLSVRRGLARLLRSVGLAVETFATVQAFLEAPPCERPACLVLDVILPGTSGLDLPAALDKAERLLPIIFITGHGDVTMGLRAMKGGAVDFLQKPLNQQELLDSIERALVTSGRLRAERAARVDIRQRHARLTPREREVMDLLVAGRINRCIAEEFGNAEKTVKIHRRSVLDKM